MDYKRKKTFVVNCLFYGFTALLIYLVSKYAMGLLTPFVFAFIIAWIMVKPAKALAKKTGVSQKVISLLMVLLFYAVLVTVVVWPSVGLIGWLIDLAGKLPGIYNDYIVPWIADIVFDMELIIMRIDPDVISILHQGVKQASDAAVNLISGWSSSAISMLTSLVASLPGFLIKMLLMVICSFFIAADYDKLTGFALRQFSERGRMLIYEVRNYIMGTLLVCLRSYLIIMSMTFVELSIALSIMKVKYAFGIAALIAVFDVLPVLGTGGIVIPWGVLSLLSGNLFLGIGLLITYVIITVIRNIVEPKIVGAQLGLHPVVTLIAMFVGVNAFGFLGIFGLPILISLINHLNNKGIIRIFK